MNNTPFEVVPLIMSSDKAAAIRLLVPDEYNPDGIDGNVVVFSNAEGIERKYQIPIYDGAPCRVEVALLQPDALAGEVLAIKQLIVDEKGAFIANLSVEQTHDAYWVTAVISGRKSHD